MAEYTPETRQAIQLAARLQADYEDVGTIAEIRRLAERTMEDVRYIRFRSTEEVVAMVSALESMLRTFREAQEDMGELYVWDYDPPIYSIDRRLWELGYILRLMEEAHGR